MRRNETNTIERETNAPDSDVFAQLQQERILFLTDEINPERANQICAQMVLLDLEDQNRDIVMFINSEGGNVTDTMAIYDVMMAVNSDVMTICIGEASSGAAILLSGGTKGKRFALPNARIMLHQPHGGVEGTSRDVEIEAKELLRLREMLGGILSGNTTLPPEKLKSIMERDTYMDAKEAKSFGIIDEVIARLPMVSTS